MLYVDLKASTSEPSKDSLSVQPKKLTWASIASQPAKPQVTVQNSGLKKKGPGMPPGTYAHTFVLSVVYLYLLVLCYTRSYDTWQT